MQAQNNRTEKNVLTGLWFRYFPYWPLFLLLLVCCVAGAWLYLQMATPMYQTTASILIKDEKKGIDDSKMIESLNLITTKKIVENEIEVLKSRSLMSEVVKNLGLYAPVYSEAKWADHSAYGTTPVKVEVMNPAKLKEAKKIYFRLTANSLVAIGSETYPLQQWVKTAYGELRFLPTGNSTAQDEPIYFSLVDPRKVTVQLMEGLDASAVNKLASVVTLKLKDEVPSRGEDILNELIKVYNNAAVREKNALASNTLSFVDERLNVVGNGLDSIEHTLQVYKSSRGAVDISQQGQLFLQNVSENDQKVSDVNIQLAALDQVENYVLTKDNKGSIVPSSFGIDDPLLSQLLTKLYDAELQYEKLKKTTAENNPMLVAVADQIQKIKPSILENIQSQRRSLQASKNNLYATNNSYSSILQTIPKKERDLVEISRQQAIQSSIYSFLLQKREEAALSYSSSVADNRLVDAAESSIRPVSPKTKLVYLIAFVAALGLGIAIVSGKELLSRKILYRSEIEQLTSFPVIGEIGYNKSNDSIVMREDNRGHLAQQFRRLRASLTYMNLGPRRKKILVTSGIPGEGKSFTVANLGLALALSGKKVAVVELDMSNPSLSDKLGVHEEKGLAAYLCGAAEPEEIIKRAEASANLFVLPAGELPHNPSELILSERLPALLDYLQNIFDYVLIDTAPVGALSDAYVIAPLCDATLYLVRHGHTPKLVVERLYETNKINELKNMAIVFNGVRPRGFGQDYGYGYGYGYVHGVKLQKKKGRMLLRNI